jgi:hypothetical protein
MGEREEVFHHKPKAVLTIGDLRRALEGLPDDVQLKVATPDSPGNSIPGHDAWEDRWVVIEAIREVDDWQDGLGHDHHDDHLIIWCDFPEDDYYRPVQEA